MAVAALAGASIFKSGGVSMVDVYADQGIWAVLDSGCNTTCRGVRAQNAPKKLADMGFSMPWADVPGKRFAECMASPHSRGKRYFLELSEGTCVDETVKSHVLPCDAPVLLSHMHQGQPGIARDMRFGAIWLKYHWLGPDCSRLASVTSPT